MSVNPKQQLSLIILSTILSAFSIASVINFINPLTAGWVSLSFFYLSLLLLALGVVTLLGFFLRSRLTPGLFISNLGNSFRQALLVSILIVVSFILLSQHLLFWWVELSLILFFVSNVISKMPI